MKKPTKNKSKKDYFFFITNIYTTPPVTIISPINVMTMPKSIPGDADAAGSIGRTLYNAMLKVSPHLT